MPQKKKQKKKRRREKIQQLMKMVNTFKLLPRPNSKPNNYRKCSMPELLPLNKKLLWIKRDLQTNQLTQNQLSKKKTMVISKPSLKSKLEWKL
jgi:hypothetical protein